MSGRAIENLCVGRVESFLAPDGRSLTTAIRKQPVAFARLSSAGFDGDQSDYPDHHTPDKAAHLFPREHYAPLEAALGIALPRPAFGENLTMTGMTEASVYVGDRYRIGGASICVTQPTERCSKIGRRLGAPKILKALHAIEACGFYAAVTDPGDVHADDRVELIARPQTRWSILDLHRVMFGGLMDDALVAAVREISELSVEWKSRLEVMRGRARRGEPVNSAFAE